MLNIKERQDLQEKRTREIQVLKQKLNSAILNTEKLTNRDIVKLSQELDELIVLETISRFEEEKLLEENLEKKVMI